MKKYNIAHFGAFDIDSFGDSLFAEIFRNEISKRIDINNITLFSVVERVKSYNNNGHVYSYDQFEEIHKKIVFDAVVIGGGEMLHFKPITFKGKNDDKKLVYPPGYLWSIPIQKAIKNNIPILFNGVGVPYSFNENQHKILEKYLPNISYMSVRDKYSKDRICENIVNKESVQCVPDSIFLIDKYYDNNKLLEVKKELSNRVDFNFSKPYIVFQYGTSYKLEEIVHQIDKIKQNYKYDIVLLPINYCHEDFVVSEKIKEQLQGEVILINEKLNPNDIIAIIANAYMFIGTSLHGNLVASVYGVKSIALDMYKSFVSKIDGLFNALNLEEYILPEPQGIYNAFNKIIDNNIYKKIICEKVQDLQKQVSNHFDEMANIIKGNKEINKITLLEKDFNGILEIQNEKYIKSYMINKCNDNCIYSVASNIKGIYNFTFEFGSEINIQNLEWNICSDYPKKMKILKCIANDNDIKMQPINLYNKEDLFDTFVDYNIKYGFADSYISCNLIIECEILNFSEDINVELLRNYNNNSLAHIELLLQSERDLQAKVSQIENTLKYKDEELSNKNIEISNKNIELNNKNIEISNKNIELNNKNIELSNKEKSIELLFQSERELQNEADSLKTQVNNKNGHIELLLQSERELERIKSSRSWRFMAYIWTFRDKVVPCGSNRRLLIKLFVKAVKHPIKFIKKCTPKRIGKFFYYLKREGVSNVSSRLDECVIGNSNEELNLNITSINEKDDKDICSIGF